MGAQGPVPVSGTLIWYYAICPREAWLMGHAIEPWQDHERLALGRLLHETAYPKARREITLPGMRIDLIRQEGTALVIGEVKLSRGAHHAHRLQLGYYLMRLEAEGLQAKGELRYPHERRVQSLTLDDTLRQDVQAALEGLHQLLTQPQPPALERNPYCASCAYYGFCWVEEA
ncbi:CRISPR-associated protein Cas4 [Marinithermus hydrothermalis]|uniref:CRISPR-associated exonuclease Cas4 n=1 Tax=Marinithermus hydrothermalis (strain DSM 14884 / JCM 11576 / T1) TaxID=869210 RepID=F2NN55_MARHT|nr:CRISPR-associated protein Cas4 [Marinithermus hydrothermalis]AEB12794.1 CRISPR-associated protein Cas4 [Marinithermus hydrothermalis DSM 14884]